MTQIPGPSLQTLAAGEDGDRWQSTHQRQALTATVENILEGSGWKQKEPETFVIQMAFQLSPLDSLSPQISHKAPAGISSSGIVALDAQHLKELNTRFHVGLRDQTHSLHCRGRGSGLSWSLIQHPGHHIPLLTWQLAKTSLASSALGISLSTARGDQRTIPRCFQKSSS